MKAFAIIQCFEDGFGPLSVTTVPPLYWTCLNSFPKTESHHSCGYAREIKTVLVHIAVIVVITVDFTIHTISIRQPSLCLTSNQDNQLCCLVERLSWDIDTLMHWYCMLPLRHVLFTLFNASTFRLCSTAPCHQSFPFCFHLFDVLAFIVMLGMVQYRHIIHKYTKTLSLYVHTETSKHVNHIKVFIFNSALSVFTKKYLFNLLVLICSFILCQFFSFNLFYGFVLFHAHPMLLPVIQCYGFIAVYKHIFIVL